MSRRRFGFAVAIRLAALLSLAPATSAQPFAPPGPTQAGLRAPVQCTVAENIAQACSPELIGVRIVITDGADTTECGNLGDAGLGAFENLCRWSDVSTAWVSDDVTTVVAGGTHPIAAGDYAAGSIDDDDLNAAAAIASSKLAPDVLVEADAGDGLEVTAGQLNTKSDELGFLEDLGVGDLVCGASTAGKVAVNDVDALQYCDGASTPVLRWAAKSNQAGQVTDFTQFNDSDAFGNITNASHTHTVGNLSDTTATAAQLDTVTNGSVADAEHIHTTDGIFPLIGYINQIAHIAASIKQGTGILQTVESTGFTNNCAIYSATGGLDFVNVDCSQLDPHAESHAVASHSDTTATGGELDTVTNGSNADAEHVHTDTGHPVLANHVDAITEIAAALKTGLDLKLVTGTATVGQCGQFDVNGDLVGAGAACGAGGGTHPIAAGDYAAGSIVVADINAFNKTGLSSKVVTGVETVGQCGQFDSNGDLVGAGAPCSATTHSSEAGGLSLAATVPKVGDDLRLIALDAADFDRTGDIASIDAAKWAELADLHADEVTATEGIEGVLDIATALEIGFGTAGAHAVTAANASSIPVGGDLSGTVSNATLVVAADHIDAITEIAAALKTGADAEIVTGTAGSTDDCAKWDVNGDLITAGAPCSGALTSDTCAVVIENPDANDKPFCGKASSTLTLVELNCTNVGGGVTDLVVTVYECNSEGHTCLTSGLTTGNMTALVTNYPDTTPTDDTIDDGDWWGIHVDSVVAAPDFVHCSVEFTR